LDYGYVLHIVNVYSGNKGKNAHHTRGVGIMMTPRATKSLIGWGPVNERIILSRFKTSNSSHQLIYFSDAISDFSAEDPFALT
jgi:hypothetical protein